MIVICSENINIFLFDLANTFQITYEIKIQFLFKIKLEIKWQTRNEISFESEISHTFQFTCGKIEW